MPSEISKKVEDVDLNSSLQSDNGIQDIKLRLKSMKKNPWDLWELERTHRSQLGSLGHCSLLDINVCTASYRNTSIICTIGPASRDVATLKKLIVAGMEIARLNFSHGTHDYHKETIENIKVARAELQNENPFKFKPIAIALDTKGPEIRTGLIKGSGSATISLNQGDKFRLSLDSNDLENGNQFKIYVDYGNLSQVVKPGDSIYMDDGLISLKVLETNETYVDCQVENGGILGSRKGINLPGIEVDLPAISEKDKSDLLFGIEQNFDMIFASFIRKEQDIEEIRECLGENKDKIKIIAKIENQEGVEKIDEILEAADGVMVARGDMGIEIPPEKVFLAQKMLISRCNIIGKPVICATQMLESMTDKPRPTRAEVSDVANAVLDGADAIMLSGETAKGRYPVQSVEMMASIAKHAESSIPVEYSDQLKNTGQIIVGATETTAISCAEAAFKCNASCIIVLTRSGTSAALISKYRPKCPIYGITRFTRAANQMQLHRGIHPIFYDQPKDPEWEVDIENRVQYCFKCAIQRGHVQPGSLAVVVTGWRPGSGSTNSMRVITVPDIK